MSDLGKYDPVRVNKMFKKQEDRITELEGENARLKGIEVAAQAVVGLYGRAGTNMSDEVVAVNSLAAALQEPVE